MPILAIMTACGCTIFVAALQAREHSPRRLWLMVVPFALHAGWTVCATFVNIAEVTPAYDFKRFGHVREHDRFLIRHHLTTIEQLEATLSAFDARIEATLAPFRDTAERLKEVLGVSEIDVQILIAEIGLDMSPFPTAAHLLSWAGLEPRLDGSAGQHRSRRIKKGAPWLKPVLEAQFLRLKARLGPKKAAIVAASILETAYHMLKDGTCYQDLGPDHFARRTPQREAEKLAKRIRSLGFDIRAAA